MSCVFVTLPVTNVSGDVEPLATHVSILPTTPHFPLPLHIPLIEISTNQQYFLAGTPVRLQRNSSQTDLTSVPSRIEV